MSVVSTHIFGPLPGLQRIDSFHTYCRCCKPLSSDRYFWRLEPNVFVLLAEVVEETFVPHREIPQAGNLHHSHRLTSQEASAGGSSDQ